MDCLTDTNCLTAIFDSLHQIAATIDYCGFVLFGEAWSPIGPGVEVHTDAFARVFSEFLSQDPAGCTQNAALVTKHA